MVLVAAMGWSRGFDPACFSLITLVDLIGLFVCFITRRRRLGSD